jgi:hypothetical protein
MIFQSNSPLSAISTEPRFKYLSPQAKKLFDDAKAKYLVLVGNTPENSQKFELRWNYGDTCNNPEIGFACNVGFVLRF